FRGEIHSPADQEERNSTEHEITGDGFHKRIMSLRGGALCQRSNLAIELGIASLPLAMTSQQPRLSLLRVLVPQMLIRGFGRHASLRRAVEKTQLQKI